ncbi:diaminopimelate epimerase [Aquimarina sp. ERC-38]|uniref:diaminopimelate epimerase n=1 Tax=Aquimarina sp. ERC-38 TaxID=2949996 RepID=UPI002246AD30|nr:diaminopimelate epimerase [Aquimarina sp. ERC-38]UZO79347.1 diaminopimelate epimerase [Aquimarina sp. ERC-38]
MKIPFYKYQGTGNDFVIIDNRSLRLSKNDTKMINHFCDRKFGIGADGLMFLENADTNNDDFKMVYFNADGNESSMCGNGGRCLVAFARDLNLITTTANFTAIDGPHHAIIDGDQVKLQMKNVSDLKIHEGFTFLNTGSPHHVEIVKDLENFDVFANGRKIREGAPYFKEGTNVNFVEQENPHTFSVRTYERGVENETLSCGTGVTAVALAMHAQNKVKSTEVTIKTPGGELVINFEKTENGYQQVYLTGPALQVFKGEITW